jgi:glycosidase
MPSTRTPSVRAGTTPRPSTESPRSSTFFLTLTHLQPTGSLQAVDPALGTLDDFDELLREAARTNLRVLVELAADPALPAADLNAAARFWVARGAAGISLPAPLPAATAQSLHQMLTSLPGHRILVAPSEADLTLAPPLDPTAAIGDLRQALAAAQSPALLAHLGPGALRESDGHPEAAKLLATLLLATRANAQLDAGQELDANRTPSAEDADPDSLLNYTRRLIDLHHGSAALRTGTDTFLDRDQDHALVWINRRAKVNAQTPAVVIACNLSAAPLKLRLTEDLERLQLRGTFLRPVLRSGPGMGGQSIDAVTLPPFGVYMGELRF